MQKISRLNRLKIYFQVCSLNTNSVLVASNLNCESRCCYSTHKAHPRRLFDYVFENENEKFSEKSAQRAHDFDGLSQSSWLLIYRDVNASRSYALCALLIPLSCMVTSLLIIDFFYHSHNHQQRSRLLQRICHDANELGILLIIPLLSIIQVVLLLLRLQYMRLFRIYQNKQHPSEFTAVLSRGCLLQKKMKFDRNSVKLVLENTKVDDTSNMMKQLFYTAVKGTIRFKNRSLIHDDAHFRANNYRSFMLNQTHSIPKFD